MLNYWYHITRILIAKNFQRQFDFGNELTRSFRVGLTDCDGLRVMAGFKYAVYMDFMRWELIARSRLFNEMVQKGLGPALASQKIIYRRPLKLWTKFKLRLQTVGWDEKWVYNVHRFEQGGEIKAIGVTKGLIWKKDKPQIFKEILKNIGATDLEKKPPEWVLHLFHTDEMMVSNNGVRSSE